MLKFDRMTVADLNLALYRAEQAGRWQEADDIALYLRSIAHDSVTQAMRDMTAQPAALYNWEARV
jgi:hypothetical protein